MKRAAMFVCLLTLFGSPALAQGPQSLSEYSANVNDLKRTRDALEQRTGALITKVREAKAIESSLSALKNARGNKEALAKLTTPDLGKDKKDIGGACNQMVQVLQRINVN